VKLRNEPKGKNIPVIALTNLADPKEKETAMKLGTKEYLIKAMQNPGQVVEKVKQYLA